MVKIMNDEFKMVSLKSAICNLKIERWPRVLRLAITLALSLIIYNSQFNIAFAQQPQAPAGTPLYSVNAKYVNGMAPGYWATKGSGLVLNLSSGTAYCGNPPVPVSYPGGSLSLTASTTNYVYLDPAQNCSPVAGTSSFAAGDVPVATVVTGATSITSIADARTSFTPQPCVTSSAGAVSCSAAGNNQNIALSPSGTGGTVIANLQDKGGQVFNVKAFGAVGNATTDDSTAFQNAYNAAVAAGGGTVYIPQSSACYRLNSTWNMTGSSPARLSIMIEGAGSGYLHSGSNPLICANTGNSPIIDMTNTSGLTFRNLTFDATVAGLSNPSEIGIISGRATPSSSGQEDKIIDCTFHLPTHTSGSTKSYGLYYYGIELSENYRDAFIADYPLTVTATNIYGLNSTLQPWTTGTTSEKGDSFIDMELDTAGLGPAATFDYTWDMKLTGHSFNFSAANPYPSGLYDYALYLNGNNYSMFIDWDQEEFPGFALIHTGIRDSTIMGTDAPGGSPSLHCIEFTDPSSQLLNDTFKVDDETSIPTSGSYYYDATSGATPGVIAIDHVNFACGNQADCVNIPIGNYVPGGFSAYERGVTWSGSSSNPNPSILIKGPLYGSFTIPVTTVNANSCVNLTSVTASTGLQSIVALSSTNWYKLTVGVVPGNGSFTPTLCNPTSSSVTTGASGTEYWKVVQ